MNEIRATHFIESVESKPNTPYNFSHEQIAFRPCLILRMDVGEFGWLAVEPEYDAGILHRFRTSKVVSIHVDGDTTMIETQNTFYRLKAYDDGPICKARFPLDKFGLTAQGG